jgi:hypothetical protein
MTDKHSEIEYKFDATHVSTKAFVHWCKEGRPYATRSGQSHTDVYYINGQAGVVRHRLKGGAGELTVKKRKSNYSTADRIEIDLTFGPETTPEDVDAFLRETGWAPIVTLRKGDVHDFKYHCVCDLGTYDVCVSLCEIANDGRRFLEVEVEKGSAIPQPAARLALDFWKVALQKAFALGEPLNESLFELYTGQRYMTAHPPTER